MIYLDAATTIPTSNEIRNRIADTLQNMWGNVSGAHQISREAKNLLEDARERASRICGVNPDSIVFTSGATEALNLVIQGYARSRSDSTIYYSAVEHPAVTKTAQFMGRHSYRVIELKVDSSAQIDYDELDGVCSGDLVCVMAVNNEIGTINNIEKVATIIRAKGARLLVDAVQAFYAFEPRQLCGWADYVVYSGHKIGAPQGIGMLVVKDRKSLSPLCFGGSQEWELRPGTTPAYLCDAMVTVFEEAIVKRQDLIEKFEGLSARCKKGLIAKIDGAVIHAANAKRTPHIVAVHIPNIEAQMMMTMLDARDICVSRGSACASGASTPSPVLIAMGMEKADARSTLRLSFSPYTTEDEIEVAIDAISDCVSSLRAATKVDA